MVSGVSYPIVYIEDPIIGGFTAYTSAVKGAIADGDTKEDALKNLREVISILAQERQEMAKKKRIIGLPNGVSTGNLDMKFS